MEQLQGWRNHPVGSAERVIAHAKRQASRGRGPAMIICGERNPKRALRVAMEILGVVQKTKLVSWIGGKAIVNQVSVGSLSEQVLTAALRNIVETSQSEGEVQRRVDEWLGYHCPISIQTKIPETQAEIEARELVRFLGVIMGNGAMCSIRAVINGHYVRL